MNDFLQEIVVNELEILSEIYEISGFSFQILEIEIVDLNGQNFKFIIGKDTLPDLKTKEIK